VSGELRLEQVEVLDEECVVLHGTQVVRWFVKSSRGWLRAARFPGASCQRLETKAGVVWQTRVQIALPPGKPVMRVESRPQREQRRDALAHLQRAARGPTRAVTRTYYRVARGGALVRTRSLDMR
jgi:hypothetical protein